MAFALIMRFLRVIDQATFDRLLPLACTWAREQEVFVLSRGSPLGPRHAADARLAGVEDIGKVRILVVDRMPLPENKELAEATRVTQVITNASRGVTFGHGIIIRADAWGDRELLLHQFVHVAQCERAGGIESFVQSYLSDRQQSEKFRVGSLEQEARTLAREICAAQPD
jgi:hypothetical protein